MYVFTNTIACILARSKSLLTGGGTPTPPAGPVATLDFNPASGVFASTIGPTPAFSRASGATMIDVTGKVVWGPENLAPLSDKLAAPYWNGYNGATAVFDYAPGPGSALATKLLFSAGPAASEWYAYVATNHPVVLSVWARSETGTSKFRFLYNSTHSYSPDFVLTTEWQRFSFAVPVALNQLGIANAADVVARNILVSQVQVERGSVARTYIPTPTSAPVYGPRITYDPISHQCLGYLAEEQRTNLVLNSEDFSLWGLWSGASVPQPNSHVAPSGAMTADTVQLPTSLDAAIYQQVAAPVGVYTVSIWAKAISGAGIFRMGLNGSDFSPDLILTNEWKRFTHTGTSAGALTQVDFRINTAGTAVTFAAWGFQCELGNFPTSYIPTTTAAATRSADLCSISGADFTGFYNQTEGTVVLKSMSPVQAAQYNMGWSTKSSVIGDQEQWYSWGFNQYNVVVTPGIVIDGPNPVSGQTLHSASAYKSGDYAMSYDATDPVVSANAASPPINQNALDIGTYNGQYFWLNGTIARLQYFPERLPDAALITLTQP